MIKILEYTDRVLCRRNDTHIVYRGDRRIHIPSTLDDWGHGVLQRWLYMI